MADFTADFTAGATVQTWDDPAQTSPALPSRINPFAEHSHLRHIGTVGTQVEVSATCAEGVAPLDSALVDGANLFYLSFAELPGIAPPALSHPAGKSSVQRFTPSVAGHYTFKIKRPEHGEFFLHLDVQ